FGATGIRALSPEAPIVLTGSHIDTVPEGGILDGALGVLAGLECIQAITETRTRHARPLVVAAWSDEEGRYGSLFGSRAFCGMLDGAKLDEMAAVDGVRLVDAMASAGFDAHRAPEARVPAGAVGAYIELHIEQGARLEEAGIPIGVVETIVGVRRARVIFVGQADHAGTTPMDRRRDAFLASADYALRVREHVVTRGGRASVTNFGVVRVHPGASNIVPGRAELVHEMRDPDVAVLERLAGETASLAREVAGKHRVGVEIQPMSATTPALCSPRIQAATEKVCATLGLGGCAWDAPMSTVAPRSDLARDILHVYGIITWIAVAIALIVGITLAWVIVRFRDRPGAPRMPPQTRGHTALEIGWTIAPA